MDCILHLLFSWLGLWHLQARSMKRAVWHVTFATRWCVRICLKAKYLSSGRALGFIKVNYTANIVDRQMENSHWELILDSWAMWEFRNAAHVSTPPKRSCWLKLPYIPGYAVDKKWDVWLAVWQRVLCCQCFCNCHIWGTKACTISWRFDLGNFSWVQPHFRYFLTGSKSSCAWKQDCRNSLVFMTGLGVGMFQDDVLN